MEHETEQPEKDYRPMRIIALIFLGLLFLHWIDSAVTATTAPLANDFRHGFNVWHQCN